MDYPRYLSFTEAARYLGLSVITSPQSGELGGCEQPQGLPIHATCWSNQEP